MTRGKQRAVDRCCVDCGRSTVDDPRPRVRRCPDCALLRAADTRARYERRREASALPCVQPGCTGRVRIVETAIKRTRVQFCSAHAERHRLGKDMDAPIDRKVRQRGECEAKDCARKPNTKGLCAAHYQRWRYHGVAFEQLGDKPLRPSKSSSNLRISALEAENRTLRDQNTLLKTKLSSGAGDRTLQAKVWRLERELEAALGGAKAVKKERTCLTCGKPFMSDGPGNRRCSSCKSRL